MGKCRIWFFNYILKKPILETGCSSLMKKVLQFVRTIKTHSTYTSLRYKLDKVNYNEFNFLCPAIMVVNQKLKSIKKVETKTN